MSKDIYSFYELVQSYSVKVPIIQRDYAQGRKRNVTICENFLRFIRARSSALFSFTNAYQCNKNNVVKRCCPSSGRKTSSSTFP